MTGTYKDSEGKLFDIIRGKKGFEKGYKKGVGSNRLFIPISEAEIKDQLKNKVISKI